MSLLLSPEYKHEWLSRIPEANRIPRVSLEDFFDSYYTKKQACEYQYY